MLRALYTLSKIHPISIHVAHLNHGIRPEAVLEADFVQQLCKQHQLDFHTQTASVPEDAHQHGRSIEMQARETRYAFLRDVAITIDASAILTAHTRNDQAETLLLNLSRGTGPSGLGGIPPDSMMNGIRVLRPLLMVNRHDIEAYLHQIGQTWCEDASNQDTRYRRNAVRHDVLPQIEALLNPKATDALARAADLLYADNQLLDEIAMTQGAVAQPAETPDIMWLAPYRKLPLAIRRRLLVSWLRAGNEPTPLRFDSIERIDALAHAQDAGGCIQVSPHCHVVHEYDRLRRRHGDSQALSARPQPLTIPGTTRLPGFKCKVETYLTSGYRHEPAPGPGLYPAQVQIRYDADKTTEIMIRQRQPGDRISMIGMNGARKIQDILTDEKVPANKRDQLPLFTIDNQVVWIPGCRPSQQWSVESADAPSLNIRVTQLDDA
jgi:tRNA(Ile)-lysidine synthase